MKSASLVRTVNAPPLPVLRRQGRGWALADVAAGPIGDQDVGNPGGVGNRGDGGHASAEALAPDVLSDLAHYGLVAPLAEVRPGCLLWWPGQPAPMEGLSASGEEAGKPLADGPHSRVHWVTAVDDTPDRWRYGVSSAARWLAASLHQPFINTTLLSLVATIDHLPLGNVHLSLPPGHPDALAWLWRMQLQRAVQRHTLLLRERRRLALGLPAAIDPNLLDAQILRRFVAPAAEAALARINPEPQRRLHVHAALEDGGWPADATPVDVAVGRYRSDDPLGENIFVLCGQRLASKSPVARQMRCTGRRLVARAHRSGQSPGPGDPSAHGLGEAMLAALQLAYLHTHRPTWPAVHGARP